MKAIVIGAGAAGATAAFRLRASGAEVLIVEREDRVGGRTRTDHFDGYTLDTGAGILPGTYLAVQRLLQDAGHPELVEKLVAPIAVARDGELHFLSSDRPLRSMASTRLLRTGSKVRLPRVAIRAMQMWSVLGFDNTGGAAQFDTETVADYARRELNTEILDYIAGPLIKTMYSVPPTQASVVDFFWCLKNLMSPYVFCIRGGMSRLVSEVLAGVEVRTSTSATAVEEIGTGVQVTLRDAAGRSSVEAADVCVIATRSCDVGAIHKGLDAEARRLLGCLTFTQTTDLHLRLRRPPDQKALVIMVPDSIDIDLGVVLFQHNKGTDRVPAGAGAISGYFSDRWGREMASESDEHVFTEGLRRIEKVVPGIARDVVGYHVQRWNHTATRSYPGFHKNIGALLARLDPSSRVQLAGDYFSMASVNAAVTTGDIAAARLISRWGAGGR